MHEIIKGYPNGLQVQCVNIQKDIIESFMSLGHEVQPIGICRLESLSITYKIRRPENLPGEIIISCRFVLILTNRTSSLQKHQHKMINIISR